ncbi:hypothetical protein ABVT39_000316 [Epinephelus coioides]
MQDKTQKTQKDTENNIQDTQNNSSHNADAQNNIQMNTDRGESGAGNDENDSNDGMFDNADDVLTSSKFNGVLSFHGFLTQPDQRGQWLVNIRRDNFTIASHSKVCSRHFATDQLVEPTTLEGRRRLVKGAVPTLFEWNSYTVEPPRRSVWERVEQPTEVAPPEEEEEHIGVTNDHCSVPEPAAMDMSASAAEDVSTEVEELRKEIQELRLQRKFGLQRFAGSDTDIRLYTRFSSYEHLMSFWTLIEPCIYKMVKAKSAAKRNEEVVTRARSSTLFWTGTASVSVSAAAAVVASAAAQLVPTAATAFPSMYSALSSSDSCCRTFLRALLLLVLLK